MTGLYAGLMSGTSLDGVDGVLVEFSPSGAARVLQHVHRPFEPAFAHELLALNRSGGDEIHRCALAANALARCYAAVVADLLAAGAVTPAQVVAIGAHGQTLRHRPQEFDGCGYTVQINNPALLAELTGIDVVADFRSRDVAAGGQGAPLVPAFHQALFSQPDQTVAVLNIGGISNLTVLPPHAGLQPCSDREGPAMADDVGATDRADSAKASADGGRDCGAAPARVLGFDCGPGNALLDYWCQRHTGQPFDRDGAWSDSGGTDDRLLAQLLAEPYLARTPPKSTGRDLFNADWLSRQLPAAAPGTAPADVQATLCEFTARVCTDSARAYAQGGSLLIVCGGGALNAALMRRMARHLGHWRVESSQAHGLPPLQVEAAAFAWLARRAVLRETGSLESVTGARGARVLGAIYPR